MLTCLAPDFYWPRRNGFLKPRILRIGPIVLSNFPCDPVKVAKQLKLGKYAVQ